MQLLERDECVSDLVRPPPSTFLPTIVNDYDSLRSVTSSIRRFRTTEINRLPIPLRFTIIFGSLDNVVELGATCKH